MRFMAVVLLIGCAHAHPPAPLGAVVDWRAVATAGASVIDAIPSANKAGCLAKAAARAVLLSAPDFIGQNVVPGLDLDISACVELGPVDVFDASSIVSVASLIIQSQAHRIEDDCTKAWLVAVLQQLSSSAVAVFAELEQPDGIVSIPPVPVDCGG